MLSAIRVFVYHEFNWFMNLHKNVVALIVHLTSLIICGYMMVRKYLRRDEEQKDFGYAVYLSSDLTLANQYQKVTQLPARVTAALFIPVGISLALELYIGVRLKKLPWLSLKSVTLGHFVIGACMWILFTLGQGSNLFISIRISLLHLIIQFLYTVKYKTFMIEYTKGICDLTHTVSSNNGDSELNDFGIFVGPKETNPELETELSVDGMPEPGIPCPGMNGPGMPVPGMPCPGMPDPGMTGHGMSDPAMSGPGMPGPGIPGPGMPDPGIPDPGKPGSRIPGPRIPGPGIPGPGMRGPGIPDPGIPDPGKPGPRIPGPRIPGPGIPGPGMRAPGMPSPGIPGPSDLNVVIEADLVIKDLDNPEGTDISLSYISQLYI
jgi:hypothetical protein